MTMLAGLIVVFAVVVVLLGISATFTPIRGFTPRVEAVCVFVACFFLLLGLRMVFGEMYGDGPVIGSLLASLAVTFFWRMWRKSS